MKTSLTYLSMMIVSLSLTACGGGGGGRVHTPPPVDDTDTIEVIQGVNLPIEFVDAKTNQLVRAAVHFSVDEASKKLILNSDGKPVTVENGSSLLVLTPEAVKSVSNEKPIKLSIIVDSEDYFATSADVVYGGGETRVTKIKLVNKSAPPAGVAIAVQKDVSTSSTGALQKAIALTAEQNTTEAVGQTKASFTLPAGTVLKDRNGQALQGDLKVSMGYFSPKAENIGDVFPGGLNPNSANVLVNGELQPQQGYFITAGLVAVDIVDSKGRKAHEFANGNKGEIVIESPADTINHETSQPVKAGDTVPVWSHNEETGQWSQEGVGTYVLNADGKLEVKYTVEHLSYWNLDWYGNTCSSVPVQFSKTFSSPTPVDMSVYVNGEYSYGSGSLKKSSDLTGLYSVPNDRIVELKFVDRNSGRTIGNAVKPINNCNTITVNIDSTFNPVVREVPIQILLTAPTGFTKDQVNLLLNEIPNISAAQRQQVLAYTHPSDDKALFILDQAAYNKLEEITNNTAAVKNLKTLMAAKIQVYGTFYGYDQTGADHWSTLDKDAGIKLTLPNADTTFKGQTQETYTYTNWWTGQSYSYTYDVHNAWLYGSLQNTKGEWSYFDVGLKKDAVIKATDTKGVIIFEDIDLVKRVLAYIRNNQGK